MGFLDKICRKYPRGLYTCLEINAALGEGSAISLGDFLKHTLEAFAQGHIPHVLVGGLAVAIHAKPRNTEDIDFIVPKKYRDELKRLLTDNGFALDQDNLYSKPTRDILKFKYKGRECDILLFGSDEFTAQVLKRAKTASVYGHSVKMISAEDLVVTKLASLRWKDKADIMAIRAKSDTLDLGYIRDRLWDLGITDRIEFLKLPVEE
jgi:predicted nucleotidyltransferase